MMKRFYLSVSFSPSPLLKQLKNVKLINQELLINENREKDLILYLTPVFEAPRSEMKQIKETVSEASEDHFFDNMNFSFVHLVNLSIKPVQADYLLSLKATLSDDLNYFNEDSMNCLKGYKIVKNSYQHSLFLGRFPFSPILREKINIIKDLIESFNSLEVKSINFHEQKFEKNYEVTTILEMNKNPQQFSHQDHRFKVI
ncbi:hypothetical protein N9N67_08670 [Bacteriovoracaceae bacterium]|nr:hypothetical protein [Bacteriovoracaceae bacterium]